MKRRVLICAGAFAIALSSVSATSAMAAPNTHDILCRSIGGTGFWADMQRWMAGC